MRLDYILLTSEPIFEELSCVSHNVRKLVLILNLRQKSLKVEKLFSQKNIFDSHHSCFMPTLIIDWEPFNFNKGAIYKISFSISSLFLGVCWFIVCQIYKMSLQNWTGICTLQNVRHFKWKIYSNKNEPPACFKKRKRYVAPTCITAAFV